MRPLPSLRTIEAFVAVARAQSLTEAARQLGLSLPALSRRIAQLEADLGTPLLRRLPRGVALTDSGAAYCGHVEKAVDALRVATHALRDKAERRAMRVSLISALANNWLMPRLADFGRRHPGIEVELQTTPDFVDVEAGAFDLAIRLGEGGWPNVLAEALLPIDIFPVCSPALAKKIDNLDSLARHELIGPAHRPEFWPEWMRGAGLEAAAMPAIKPIDGFLLYEAAANGMGVAIGLAPIVGPFLASGRLVRALDCPVRSSRSFYLVRSRKAPARAVQSFRRWLLDQARADAEPPGLSES